MPADTAALLVRDLAKSYGELEAVRGLSFELGPGEIVGLLGPNGAGKTSVIECVAGLRQPDRGEVWIAGIDARQDRRQATRHIGVALQATGLQDHITPREALTLFSALNGAALAPEALLTRFGLDAKADARYATLSGGQKQRLALALAFVNDPAVLILDEPTVGLDLASCAQLHETIAGMRTDGRAVLLATHDMQEAQALCDRLLVIDAGRLVAEGSPRALIGASLRGTVLEVETSAPPVIGPTMGDYLALIEATGCNLRFSCTDLHRGLADLIGLLDRQAISLCDVTVSRATLADVVRQLTGP